MSFYKVIGRTPYRGHQPGATFEADLDPKAEERAIRRRAIELLSRKSPTLRDGSWTLPRTTEKEGSNA
jgi:hypothetical protein